jgi:hypothetical protein
MFLIATILLATLTIFFSFAVTRAAAKGGRDVESRFLEHGSKIPSMNEPLTKDSLEKWLRRGSSADVAAKTYRGPVMVFDIFFLLSFGSFLAIGSIGLGQLIPGLGNLLYFSALLIFPVVYTVTDFIEDLLIRQVLSSPPNIGAARFNVMRSATTLKTKAAAIALLQLFVLALLAMWFHLSMADCPYAGVGPLHG